jgi:hypothetical protein
MIYSKNYDCPIILCNGDSNGILKFHSTDSEELYKTNKKIFGPDWYYYNNPIEYKYNSWGYRTSEFNEISDNYFLTFGCSYTEGIGLHSDDMWVNKLSNGLNIPSFNIAKGGTGIQFSIINSILFSNFCKKNNKFPKFVIYQLSFSHRALYSHFSNDELFFEPFSASFPFETYPPLHKYYKDWYFYSYIENGAGLETEIGLGLILLNNIWNFLNIPVYFWVYGADLEPYSFNYFESPDILYIDDIFETKARDCAHNGREVQTLISDTLTSKILNKNG